MGPIPPTLSRRSMETPTPRRNQVPSIIRVGHGALLDARLALFHHAEQWLAVADLHFGLEISARRRGALVPEFGMEEVERRLSSLLRDYKPKKLIIVGDLVEDRASALSAMGLLKRLRTECAEAGRPFEPVLIEGNHDRHGLDPGLTVPYHTTETFCFYHGDRPEPAAAQGRVSVIGHFHPATTMRDGAGLRLKLPAFVQDGTLWTLPAFSPWAAGMEWNYPAAARVYAMGHGRVLQVSR
ncbi:MAG: metallophosphoesterase [Verrucomicrobia bacterium]|nr:metallophosphoesterase [Verrucomicrobiota bacterium]